MARRSGLQNLHDLVTALQFIPGLGRNRYPIVLVPGFSSFGEPLFGSINYWGGFEDLASALQIYTGVPVILPRIGPFSSNWERACELYCQLDNIYNLGPVTGFDTPATSPPTPVGVDYGQYIPLPTPPPQHSTKQAVLLGMLPGAWRWNSLNPVHMICHSQGGNTVRLLIELLSGNHGPRHPGYFGGHLGNRQNFVKSVVTLGTPYLGTTITSVIFDHILRDVQVDEVISRLVVSASLNPNRFVDLQLDHWGFTPQPGETFLQMYNRLRVDIGNWWASDNNAVKDNGVAGIARMNRDFAPTVSAATYYFTMSFDATRPLPREYLSGEDLKSIPVHPLLSLGGLAYPGPFDWAAHGTSFLFGLGRDAASLIPGTPSDVAYAKWAAEVINHHLRVLGYRIRAPSPGGRIPRDDMLPVLSIFSIGMSGISTSLGLSEQNDGVVDTSSMRGPASEPIQDIVGFNRASIPGNRGVYWDLGLTEGIDHADEVGVFTVPATYMLVLRMYRRLGDLLSFL
ncbi:hypothetical protein B0J13DRAFT_489877 [Dactylonectria estremocensis]|uniref:Lipase-like C-terminal domain-containing protein n=1 Tax=Dactylonectria estremocensis TaxID=1079267 RepID=A0A9P9CZN5_9HYPO|nr:hypothetical protein B0J13DRAFT_489877 [Dactylonectria estremocensis]